MSDRYELLGQFYLGKRVDENGAREEGGYYLYPSADLTTHAVAVGMTGSGKTGLCIDLLEEAAMDGLPAIIVDPKGDMANLLLNFPDLAPASFKPWLSAEEAHQKGLELDQWAEETAQTWRQGLADWDQDPDRMARLKEAVDRRLYTPGSTAARPISLTHMGDAPGPAVRADRELFLETLRDAASDILRLAGLEADPLTSREHLLLSAILERAWQEGESLSLSQIVEQIMEPGLAQVGILPLERVYPQAERMKLAMTLNTVLAAPSFAIWQEGEGLDVEGLLYTKEGKARHSILSLAHLNEQERSFFLTHLLHKLIAWMRQQKGQSGLRALFYMDELFGYLPPVANPPTKAPLLVLLKQARAYGLGLVLATQNPVDLDYKALSNIGTWFIGRLQTQQDRDRLLNGLSEGGAEWDVDQASLDQQISALPKRVFLVRNVHAQRVERMESRWAMSYLAGPLSRPQLASLMGNREAEKESPAEPVVPGPSEAPSPQTTSAPSSTPPLLEGVEPYFWPEGPGTYVPTLYALVEVTYSNRSVNQERRLRMVRSTPIEAGPVPVDWSRATGFQGQVDQLSKLAPQGAVFQAEPVEQVRAKDLAGWQKALVNYIYRNDRLPLYENKRLGLVSQPEEDLAHFQRRVDDAFRSARDQALADLKSSYQKKLAAAERKIETAKQRLGREEDQASQARQDTLIQVGATLLDGLLGRKIFGKSTVSKAATAARTAGRERKQHADIDRAQVLVSDQEEAYQELVREMEEKLAQLQEEWNRSGRTLEKKALSAKQSDIHVAAFFLVWLPEEAARVQEQAIAGEAGEGQAPSFLPEDPGATIGG